MLRSDSRGVRRIFGGSLLVIAAGLGMGSAGCDLAASHNSGSRSGYPISRAASSNLPPNYEGATPDGAGGGGVYDQPGALPGNAGGTNAGRSGVDDQKQFENR